MNYELKVLEENRTHLLVFKGRLTIGGPCIKLRDQMRDLLANGKAVVVDLSEVTMFGAQIMHEIIDSRTFGQARFVTANGSLLNRVLTLFRFTEQPEFFVDPQSAITSFE